MEHKKNLSNICSHFGSTTTLHGVPNLISAKSLKLRIFWSIVCLASLVMFLYLFSKLLEKYYSYPVVVKIQQVTSALTIFLLLLEY